jgi:DNA polymerase-3 subunit gamma/tau
LAHVSLYRKYRSQTFAEVIGQDHVTTTLANAVTEDRLHHAYLFTGPRGTGKTSTARILAKSVNCVEGPTATPCNVCTQCVAITAGSSIDVIEIDAASHGGVDDVRELRDRVAFAPASARMKVYIVDECHMLSTQGWNAFLKTVEEPPGHVLFVFATTEPHKVLDTILSRTQRFDFKRIAAGALLAHCLHLAELEGVTAEPGAMDLIVRAGDGSARDTLSVLDQVMAYTGPQMTLHGVVDVLGTVGDDLLSALTGHLARGDVPGVCGLIGRLVDSGQDLRQFSRDAIEHLRGLLMLKVAPDAGLVDTTAERIATMTAQAQSLGQVELLRAIELLADAQAQMRRGTTRLPLEVALIKAALPEACGDPAALAARLDRLERRTGMEAPAPSAQEPKDAATAPQRQAPQPSAPEPVAVEPSAPEPVAVEPSAPEPVAVDLGFVQQTWPAVIEAVKARSRRLEAFLSPGRPIGLEGDTLTLAFGPTYGFHAEQCASEEWRAALGEVLTTVLGVDLRVRCTVSDGAEPDAVVSAEEDPQEALDRREAAAVAETEAEEAAGEGPDDTAVHDLAVQTLTRDLGATVVDDQGGRRSG